MINLKQIRVGITMGDPSGIGPLIIQKALREPANIAEFTIIGDRVVFERALSFVPKSAKRKEGFRFADLKNVPQRGFSFGKVHPDYGRASIEYLDKALSLIRNQEIDCLVTCPISKEAIRLGGSGFSGHTEYFAVNTHTSDFAMMLLNRRLKFTLLTRHIPLKDVSGALNKEMIKKAVILTHNSLKSLFLIRIPRMIACGLNPHASDNGVIGNEENSVFNPALEELKEAGLNIDGPISSDIAILRAKDAKYDAIIAAYHDQALIALKLSASGGVNLTLGLPFVRTSPLHGTAFDIAGTNLAKPDSLMEAIQVAVRCCRNLRERCTS